MRPLSPPDRFFTEIAPAAPGDTLVAAFSGGTDSLALLLLLARLAPRRSLGLVAAHLDHGLDPGSAARAAAAGALARRLGVVWIAERIEVGEARRRGESAEAAARRVRYGFLERVRRDRAARWIATAHHADDQAETVLLRIAAGTGVGGLAGIEPRRGRIVRPLLGVRRAELAATVATAGLEPVDDASNLDLAVPRNRVRHRLLPRLEAAEPGVGEGLARLAESARAARAALETRLDVLLSPRRRDGGVEIGLDALAGLPAQLWPLALARLHRLAGRPYPPSARAAAELRRQLAGGGGVGCDAGGGWRWRGHRGRLRLAPAPAATAPFAYTFAVPGEIELPELGARFRVERRPVAPWMLRGSPRRAGLALPIERGDRVTVRARRPGDRLRPLGCGYRRRLKEVLIDRRVPRAERDRIPLLVVDGRIAWVPGVTIDERFRIGGETRVWVAEIEAV